MGQDAIRTKRIYEHPEPSDGYRVLVDRLWPRGVSRERAAVDEWARDLAPTPDLRKWFAHDPDRFEEFARRYEGELAQNPGLDRLAQRALDAPLTLLYAAADSEHNHAVVLAGALTRARDRPDAGR